MNIFYKLFIKSLPISVRWEACVASDSVLFRSKETPRNGIFARVLTLVPRSLLRNPRTPGKLLLRRLSGEHSLRRRLHLWLKTERTKHGMHYPHTGITQSRQSIFIFHDLESHFLLDSDFEGLSFYWSRFVRERKWEVLKACFSITIKFTCVEMLRKAECKTLFGRRNLE